MGRNCSLATAAPWFPSRIAFGKYKGRSFHRGSKRPGSSCAWLEWLATQKIIAVPKWAAGTGLQQLSAVEMSAPLETLVGDGVLSESGEVVIYLDPELETLRGLIVGARTRLADLEAEYAQERHPPGGRGAVPTFALLRPYYEMRDQLTLVIQYRRSFIETLLASGEGEAESIESEYENARNESEREYEEGLRHKLPKPSR